MNSAMTPALLLLPNQDHGRLRATPMYSSPLREGRVETPAVQETWAYWIRVLAVVVIPLSNEIKMTNRNAGFVRAEGGSRHR